MWTHVTLAAFAMQRAQAEIAFAAALQSRNELACWTPPPIPKRPVLLASKCMSCGAPLYAMRCAYCGGYHRMEGERP